MGRDHWCYGLLDSRANRFTHIRYVELGEREEVENLAPLFEMLPANPAKVIVCSAYPGALVAPQQYFKDDFALLKTVEGLPSQSYLSDRITEWQMVTTYSIPETMYNQLLARYPHTRFFHIYTPSIRVYNGSVAEQQIDLHFSTRQFRVLVRKNSTLQLVQTYEYRIPLDVVYYLLKICEELQLDQSKLFLVISGLVDKDSALYAELYNYFLNIQFAPAPGISVPDHGHPHYYFTSLYNLATCGS